MRFGADAAGGICPNANHHLAAGPIRRTSHRADNGPSVAPDCLAVDPHLRQEGLCISGSFEPCQAKQREVDRGKIPSPCRSCHAVGLPTAGADGNGAPHSSPRPCPRGEVQTLEVVCLPHLRLARRLVPSRYWVRMYVENMNKEGMTVLASYRTEKQALTATCNAMSEPRMTGEGAVYPGVKATIGTDVYDVGAFVTYGDGSWPCRDPEPDEDSDGVPDGVPNVYRRDRCPGTPAGTTVDMSGCPCKEGGDCAEQCIQSIRSPCPGRGQGWPCFCSCEFGYEGDKTGTCVISEAACTKACREYHGTDKSHGPDAYGTVDDDVCNCHCAEGYAPDETLTCVKQESCEEVCQKARGEGATGAGTPPNCRCDCKPAYVPTINYDEQDRKVVCVKKVCPNNSDLNEETGECICREGFHPEPVAGVCVKKTAATRCGNNVCNTEYVDDLYKENCQNCPPDCKCPAGTSCTPTHPGATIENWGCVKVAAKIINMGCSNIRDIPDVSVQRAGTGPDDFFHLGTELPLELNKGDGVRLTTTGLVTRKPCEGAYLTMQWGDTVGTVYLDDALYHDMTIGETAVDSGWPDEWAEWTDPAVGVGKFGLKWGIKWVIKTLVGWKAKVAAGPVISVLMGPGKTAGGAVKVYAKSHLVIWQTPAEVVVHTLEGEAQVDDGKRLVTVGEGMKATVREGATGDPVAFDPAEIPEQYRIDPLALQEELEGSAPEAVVGGPATRTGITGWAAPAACVGLLTALLAGGALVVWQRSRRGGQPRRAPAERGAAAPGPPTRAPHGQATPQQARPTCCATPDGLGQAIGAGRCGAGPDADVRWSGVDHWPQHPQRLGAARRPHLPATRPDPASGRRGRADRLGQHERHLPQRPAGQRPATAPAWRCDPCGPHRVGF